MKKLVIDTSVVVKWFSSKREKYFGKANLVLKEVIEGRLEVLALDLIYYELANALFWGKKLSPQKTIEAMEVFSQIPMRVFSYEDHLLKIAVRLMEKRKLAFYDATFVALAKREKCPLLSADVKHHGNLDSVLLLKDFE